MPRRRRPRPLGVYGQSKVEGEQAVLGALERALVVRTSVVYGPERQEKNSAYQLIRACRSGKGFRPAVDQRASPSYNPDVAAATVECCERELRGIWHLAGADMLDRMAYARLVCRVFDLDGSLPHSRDHRRSSGRRRPARSTAASTSARHSAAPHAAARRRGGAARDARRRWTRRPVPAPERPLTSPETYGTAHNLAVVPGR